MPDKFEITVPLPPAMVIKRLEEARKKMAPKIGTLSTPSDRAAFTCRIDLANAFALLNGIPQGNGESTKVLVEIESFNIWSDAIGKVTLVPVL